MSQLTALAIQVTLAAMVLASTFGGPALAAFLLAKRKRAARTARRSPIGIHLLRSPGHALRDQLDEVGDDVLGDVIGLCIVPPLMLTIYLAQSHFLGTPDSALRGLASAGVALALSGVLIRRLLKASVRADTLRLGLDAELAVGQELDQLMRQGAAVFHDVPGENFNIDHVVVSREGVFAVETKGYSKRNDLKGKTSARVAFDGTTLRFPGWETIDPIEQAKRQANWLSKWLSSAIAGNVPTVPVLALPGWFVERVAEGSVEVYNGKELAWLLKRNGHVQFRREEVGQMIHQLDQRCRTVSPLYRND